MIVLTMEQGSSAWLRARLGIPTASNFDKILTPSTGKVSTQARGYAMSLLSEWLIGVPAETAVSGFMDRGTMLEPLARKWYANEHDVEVKQVGIVLRDDRLVGASPDAFVGEDGTLEVKCPAAATHVGYLLEGLPRHYNAQIQGALWLSGRAWTDLLAYHPDLPPIVQRIERDEEYIAALDAAVSTFVENLLRMREALIGLGCKPAGRLMLTTATTDDPF